MWLGSGEGDARRTERREYLAHLGHRDEALTLAVERLEPLHEVGQRARVLLLRDGLVDGQELLELVLPLACTPELTSL